jgi:hypothetical protein
MTLFVGFKATSLEWLTNSAKKPMSAIERFCNIYSL